LDLDEQLAPPPLDEAPEQMRRLAREYLDEIGAMGLLRQVRGSARRHAGIERFELRLLENLDALAALGHGHGDRIDVLREVEEHARAAFVPDPWRAFAAAFVLGCTAGREGVRDALCMLKSSHVDTHAAQFEALALCPNPEIDAAMCRLCDEADTRWLESALGVLIFRGTIDFGTAVVLSSHPSAGVRREAARALGRVAAKPAAIEALEHALADETNAEAAITIAESLVRLEAPSGLRWLRDNACVHLLAVLGEARDRKRIAEMAAIDPDYADAVGWYGDPSLLAALVAEIDRGDDIFRRAVERAVWRVSGGRDLRELDAQKRYRFGEPYSVEASLDELEHGDSSADERRTCALEVAVHTGIVIEPNDWVSRQRAAIEAAQSSSSTGLPRRRRMR
jgi:HEAT repeat protein